MTFSIPSLAFLISYYSVSWEWNREGFESLTEPHRFSGGAQTISKEGEIRVFVRHDDWDLWSCAPRPLRVTIDCATEHRKRKCMESAPGCGKAGCHRRQAQRISHSPGLLGIALRMPLQQTEFFCTTLNSVSLNPQLKNDKVWIMLQASN